MAFRFTTPFIVSFGEESFFLDRDFNEFRDQPNRTVSVVDGDDISDSELASVCSTIRVDMDDPSKTKPRVVVVDNAHKFKPEKALKAYADEREPRNLNCVLALIVRDKKPAAFWGKLGNKVTLREFHKLKTWENNNEVVKWVQDEAKEMGLTLDSRIANLMFQIAGDDLYRLASELRKLVLLVGPGVAVTVEHLMLVMSHGTTAEPWTVAEATFAKNPKKALNALSALYKHAGDDPALAVLSFMMKQAEKLFVARAMLDQGAAQDDVAARLGMHPFRFKMSLLPQVGKHHQRGLALAMQNLCKLDVDLKRASHSRRTLLELAILGLAS
jgi:DNA polymerase III delta subunit